MPRPARQYPVLKGEDYQKFLSHFKIPDDVDDCWLWDRPNASNGYGYFPVHYEPFLAHRLAYTVWVDNNLSPRMWLDHLCRVPACINPSHLEPVTHRENVRRGRAPAAVNMRKTHCPRGHPYDRVFERRQGKRIIVVRECTECTREISRRKTRRYYRRHREKVLAYAKKYYKKNRDRIKAYAICYRQKIREKSRE